MGLIGGAARGASSILTGSQRGATIVNFAGPISTVSGAFLGAVAGGMEGSTIGADIGEKLDRYLLMNNICLSCGHRFNLSS